MVSRIPTALACLALLLVVSGAQAKRVPACSTPRDAADSVFSWQLGDQQSREHASRCFERAGRTPKELEETARRLKMVYDAEGALIDPEIFLAVMRLAEKLGVGFAFPTRTLHVDTMAQPERRARSALGPDGATARPGGPGITSKKHVADKASDRGDYPKDEGA